VRSLAGEAPGSAALRRAALHAGTLLVRAASAAPESARFFRAVGSAMALADEEETGGAHRDAIRNAFSAHGIALGSHGMLAPTAALEGPGPTPAAGGAPASRHYKHRGRWARPPRPAWPQAARHRRTGSSRHAPARGAAKTSRAAARRDRARPEGVLISRRTPRRPPGALPKRALRGRVLPTSAFRSPDRIDYGTGGGAGGPSEAGLGGTATRSAPRPTPAKPRASVLVPILAGKPSRIVSFPARLRRPLRAVEAPEASLRTRGLRRPPGSEDQRSRVRRPAT
jgi:hypothetical protein